MRGPVDSPLHTPEQLLRVARDAGLGLPLEHLAVRRAISAFVAAALPGRLFINLSGAMIVDVIA
jgi:EAL domain-containing protein (putative c-di-GMP-specific phosphodiesterase class I)